MQYIRERLLYSPFNVHDFEIRTFLVPHEVTTSLRSHHIDDTFKTL